MTALPPFARTSSTSRAGAIDAYERSPTQKQRVLDYLREHPEGATRRQLADALGLEIGTVCARVGELHTAGSIEVDGTRKSRYGIANEVLRAVVLAPRQEQLL